MESPANTAEIPATHELEVDSHSIGIATATLYKNWFPGDVHDYSVIPEGNRTDKIRGDLAIQTLEKAKQKGFQIVVVDGDSSEEFRERLKELGVLLHDEKEPGVSSSRRQAFREISRMEGVKVIAWIEPEKLSIVQDCLPEAALPILEGRADIVVPKRDQEAFTTYPDYQVVYEQKANRLWNEILRKHGLLPQKAEDLDVWFGPRFIRNDPAILDLFLRSYHYNRIPPIAPLASNEVERKKNERELGQIYNPELWPDATFLPIVNALHEGLRVKSLLVHYHHAQKQTANEKDSKDFRRKREIQYKNIIIATANLIKALEANPKSRFTTS